MTVTPRSRRLVKERGTCAAVARRHAVDQHGERGHGAVTFKGHRSRQTSLALSSSRAPSGERGYAAVRRGSPTRSPDWKVLERRRQLGARRCQHTFRSRGSGAAALAVAANASNRIGAAAERPNRPGTGAPSGRRPRCRGVLAVEADPTSIAIAVTGTGLERDAPADAFSGGGVPRSTWLTYQAATGVISRLSSPTARQMFAERQHGAAACRHTASPDRKV